MAEPGLGAADGPGQAVAFELAGARFGAFVPLAARLRIAETGAGIEQHQGAHPLGMREMEAERHDAAQGQPANHRAFDAAGIEHRRHVADRQRVRIERGVGGIAGLAMAAHVPQHETVAIGEDGDLPIPHPAGRAIAVRQQDRWRVGGPVDLVMDADPVAVDCRHATPPLLCWITPVRPSRRTLRVLLRMRCFLMPSKKFLMLRSVQQSWARLEAR